MRFKGEICEWEKYREEVPVKRVCLEILVSMDAWFKEPIPVGRQIVIMTEAEHLEQRRRDFEAGQASNEHPSGTYIDPSQSYWPRYTFEDYIKQEVMEAIGKIVREGFEKIEVKVIKRNQEEK